MHHICKIHVFYNHLANFNQYKNKVSLNKQCPVLFDSFQDIGEIDNVVEYKILSSRPNFDRVLVGFAFKTDIRNAKFQFICW